MQPHLSRLVWGEDSSFRQGGGGMCVE